MIVWMLNHYADTPDGQATRSYDLGRGLVSNGHRVTIFASSFSHYSFKEMRLQPGERVRIEDIDGVRFVWLRTTPYVGNGFRRILNMLSYAQRAVFRGMHLDEKPDVIIGTCVHPLAPLAAYLLSILKGSRFCYEVTDLWPESLISLGALSPRSPVTFGLRLLEKFLFRKAQRIITVLPHTEKYIVGLGIARDKIVWIPNGADGAMYDGLESYSPVANGRFTVMYVGSLTVSNALEVVLEAAWMLQRQGRTEFRFVLIGDGAQRRSLVQRSREMGLRNVEFRGLVPRRALPGLLREADAFVSSQRNVPLYQYGLSQNKMVDYLFAGRPIIHAGMPETSPVAEAGCGIVVPPENARALAEAIVRLAAMDVTERQRLGRNGREYARRHYDMRMLAERLEQALLDVAGVTGAP
jgi:glycosyltransferase involved in cell wall biosynthesis